MGGKKEEKSTKTVQKQKKATVEDLTFGLKNKNKSKVVQKYVKEVNNKVMFSDVKGGAKAVEDAKRANKSAKSAKEEQADFLQSLFKQVTQVQTTEDGQIDYKATLCPYFKAGVCEKGKKCKYSHDLSVADQKESNIDIYTDPRQRIGKAPVDTIITCNDFVKAVEKDLYGFNWVCPNKGDDCPYMHRLPQGYVLIKDKKKKPGDDSDEEIIPLEEQIEAERQALPSAGLIPVTLENFKKWKEDKAAKKQADLEAKMEQEKAKGTKAKNVFTGKALFTFNPDLFEDDDAAVDDDMYEERVESDEEETKDESEKPAAKKAQQNVISTKAEPEVDEDLFKAGEDLDEDVDFD